MFFNRLKRTFKRLSSKFTWKRRFPGNTWLGENVVGVENIEIGKGTYGCINILTSATNPRLIIGSFCSIAKDVTFVIEDDHPMNLLSTFPFRVKCLGESVVEASGKGGIVIEDDVWLGYRATVLDGVKIGQGGCCCWCARYQGCSSVHHRWRRSRTAYQEALRRRYCRFAYRVRFFENRRELDQGPYWRALPAHGPVSCLGAAE